VGGTAAWDGTAGSKWALTSGGAGGQAVPTSADDVFFSSLSTGTCTISTGNTGAKSINCTGFTGTLTGTAAITVSGSITLVAGMTYSYTGSLLINATSTLTSGGKTHGPITFRNLSGGTLTLGSACTLGTTRNFDLSAGTLNLNGFTLSTGVFQNNTGDTRAITFGSANIALTTTTAAASILVIQTGTNFSWTGTGGFTRNQAATANIDIFGLGGGTVSNAVNLTVNAGSSTLTFVTAGWIKNLIFSGSTCTVAGSVNMAGNLTLASGGTYTSVVPTFLASGTVTSVGRMLGNTTVNASGGTLTLADAMTLGSTSIFTLTQGTLALANSNLSTGRFVSSNSFTRAISFGTGNIALTSIIAGTTVLDMGTATNFTMTTSGGGFTRNQAVTATMAFGTTGGTTSNAPNLTVNAGASTLTITNGSWFKNLVFTGSTSTVTALSFNVAGNLTLASGGTYTSVYPEFRASGTLTCAGRTLASTTINGSGITVTLADAFSGSGLGLTQGTLTTSNFNVTTSGPFNSSNSNTRVLNMGSSTFTVGTNFILATSTGMTLNSGTSTVTMTSALAKTFFGGGLTYYNLNQGGAGTLTISGSNTFNNITNTTQPATVTFTAGTTQTVSSFGLSGTAGNLITINSTTPGSQFTLSDPSGIINAQYLSIQDSNATGGATWRALISNGNVNAGNNTGWIFSLATGNMFLMFNG
jgi:hypothetical protein